MRVAGCAKLSLHPLTGHWFRALNLKLWNSRLSSDHSKTSRSRFSVGTRAFPAYRILYLGENHQVAIYEVGALLGDPNAPISSPKGSWILLSLSVRLHNVADLCDAAEQRKISTNRQELTGAWANDAGTAPTQKLGASLHAVPTLEAFTFPSSKLGARNLAVFPDKLDPKSSIMFYNELDGKYEQLR
jgi:RES domain